MHHANGKLPPVAAAAPNHTPPYEITIQSKSPEYGGSSNAGDLYNDWGAKISGLVASERATVVTIEREGTVDNKPCNDDVTTILTLNLVSRWRGVKKVRWNRDLSEPSDWGAILVKAVEVPKLIVTSRY